MRARSPIGWMGGKFHLADRLISMFPKHWRYVEPFGGAAHVLLAKAQSKEEHYSDINPDLVNLLLVVQDKKMFHEFMRLCSLTPYSRGEFYYSREVMDDQPDQISRAWRFFVVLRQAFGGIGARRNSHGGINPAWGYGASGMSAAGRWVQSLEMFPAVHRRLHGVSIRCCSWQEQFATLDGKGVLFYCDPPYVAETRKSGAYNHEMTDKDHLELLAVLTRSKGKIILSGYQNDMYQSLVSDHGWTMTSVDTVCRCVGKTKMSGYKGQGKILEQQQREEVIWRSPSCFA